MVSDRAHSLYMGTGRVECGGVEEWSGGGREGEVGRGGEGRVK